MGEFQSMLSKKLDITIKSYLHAMMSGTERGRMVPTSLVVVS